MPRIQLAHYAAHYQQQGHGPDVVVIHGFTSNLAMWVFSGITISLADRFRVTAYDLRGHGASSAPASGYTSAHLADDLADLHAALGLGPTYLLGHSLGGVVAMHAAVLHPSLVAGVVLSDSYFPGLAAREPNMPHAEVWQSLRQSIAAAGHEIGPTVDFRALLNVIAKLDSRQQATLTAKLGPPAVRWLSQLRPLAGTSAAEEVFETAGLSANALASIRQPVVALYDERHAVRDDLALAAEEPSRLPRRARARRRASGDARKPGRVRRAGAQAPAGALRAYDRPRARREFGRATIAKPRNRIAACGSRRFSCSTCFAAERTRP